VVLNERWGERGGDEEERFLWKKREMPIRNKVGEGNDNYKKKATRMEDRVN
jgi:hypothetical protein